MNQVVEIEVLVHRDVAVQLHHLPVVVGLIGIDHEYHGALVALNLHPHAGEFATIVGVDHLIEAVNR